MSEERQGFYYIIPAPLAESGDFLKAMIYGLITSLARNTGECGASNAYLAKKLNRKSITIISNAVNELQKDGWITVTQDKSGNDRKISINPTLTEKRKGPSEKTKGYPYGKTQDSSISISIKKSSSPERSMKYLGWIDEKEIFHCGVPKSDLDNFKENYRAGEVQIEEKAERLLLWCLKNGKEKKNYKAFLRDALSKDFGKRTKEDKILEERVRRTVEGKDRSSSFAKELSKGMKMS